MNRVIVSEPSHLNDSFIQERITETQNSAVAVFGVFFVGEMEQKLSIWCLKHKSLNINIVY